MTAIQDDFYQAEWDELDPYPPDGEDDEPLPTLSIEDLDAACLPGVPL